MSFYVKKEDAVMFKGLLIKEMELKSQYKKQKRMERRLNEKHSRKERRCKQLDSDCTKVINATGAPSEESFFESLDDANTEKQIAQAKWDSAKNLTTSLYSEYWDALTQLNKILGCSSDRHTWMIKSSI